MKILTGNYNSSLNSMAPHQSESFVLSQFEFGVSSDFVLRYYTPIKSRSGENKYTVHTQGWRMTCCEQELLKAAP